MFLSYYICHSLVVDHLEIDKLFNSLFSSVHHSFSVETVTIVELYFCQNFPLFHPQQLPKYLAIIKSKILKKWKFDDRVSNSKWNILFFTEVKKA